MEEVMPSIVDGRLMMRLSNPAAAEAEMGEVARLRINPQSGTKTGKTVCVFFYIARAIAKTYTIMGNGTDRSDTMSISPVLELKYTH